VALREPGGLMKETHHPKSEKPSCAASWSGRALAFGTALCVVDTYASIAFIVLVQLNFAIAPGVDGCLGF